MIETISFDQLKEAPHYIQSIPSSMSGTDSGLSFLDTLKNTIPLPVSSVYITNYHHKDSVSVVYILRLTRDQLECLELSTSPSTSSPTPIRNNIVYSFNDQTISLNGNTMSSIYFTAFKKRVTQIINDLNTAKCDVFEEII